MRSICATLIALCLVMAGSARAPHFDAKGDGRTPTVDTAPVSMPTAVKHRRRALVPDAGLGPTAVPVIAFDRSPPRVARRVDGGPASRAPAHADTRPHTARGPPRA